LSSFSKIGHDWFELPAFYTRKERQDFTIEVLHDGIFLTDKNTGKKEKLEEPQIGGTKNDDGLAADTDNLPETQDDIDAAISALTVFDTKDDIEDGSGDLAARLLNEFGSDKFPIFHVLSPLWKCYFIWGFEGLMMMTAANPDAVKYACSRFLEISKKEVGKAASLGAAGIWIEECFTDIISPEAFKLLNIPYVSQLIDVIHAAGLKSIYYFTGNPMGRLDQLISTGTDAISLEESKKGFKAEIEDITEAVRGRCTVLGNLDSVEVLQNGTEEQLRQEIKRQLAVGRLNNNRFIMSLGSPVTPATSVEKVRLYCDLVHELGAV
jgi:hypothetical protein